LSPRWFDTPGTERLAQVTAPHFTAGLVIRDGYVVRAAPILAWAVTKRWLPVYDYFVRKRYLVRML
jgi:hypothetical protein